jgi:uncharacterized membrane protein YccC
MPGEADGKQNVVVVVTAIAVLVAFAVVLGYMIRITGADERLWTRATYLFGSVEAIAFAAAGFLFGREVHREQAAKAEKRADAAEQTARQASSEAAQAQANGESLAELAQLKAASLDQRRGLENVAGEAAEVASSRSAAADLREIAQMARQLFP